MYACTRAHGENNLCTTGLEKIMEKGNVVESSIYDQVENNKEQGLNFRIEKYIFIFLFT